MNPFQKFTISVLQYEESITSQESMLCKNDNDCYVSQYCQEFNKEVPSCNLANGLELHILVTEADGDN